MASSESKIRVSNIVLLILASMMSISDSPIEDSRSTKLKTKVIFRVASS